MKMDRLRHAAHASPQGAFPGRRPVAMPRAQGGFTMVELIIIMVVGGIIAVYALPKMASALAVREGAWRDEVVSALRYAQKGAVARRRLTCVSIATTTVTITSATVNPATSCTVAVTGPTGDTNFATASTSDAATAVSPSGTLFFQPDGRVTSDGAGNTASTRTITMNGGGSITVYGETGSVQ